MPSSAHEARGQEVAVAAEALYLANLLVAPGLAFALLLWLWRRTRPAPPLAACHLRQTLTASLWAGFLLVVVAAGVAMLGGIEAPPTWVFLILYFTTFHSMLVLFGAVGLARAMAGRPYRYPLFGAPCPEVGP
ncbi:hypothetical protein [Inmirania thermothiophila]|uniref:Cytochrome C oxidase subunit III n=1 Tax=Inmirania thermothiophila TaxID=1750597 RepID=A0A3N1XWC1_9GAMM|nr:hypothetical protein [Inmirania thermothiophila]ROR29492.1 hypothetical protein EDC57_2162 [Inmirania thermothiophila]